MTVQPHWGFHNDGAGQELRKRQGCREQEYDAPSLRSGQLETHCLRSHDTNDNGKLGEDTCNNVQGKFFGYMRVES